MHLSVLERGRQCDDPSEVAFGGLECEACVAQSRAGTPDAVIWARAPSGAECALYDGGYVHVLRAVQAGSVQSVSGGSAFLSVYLARICSWATESFLRQAIDIVY